VKDTLLDHQPLAPKILNNCSCSFVIWLAEGSDHYYKFVTCLDSYVVTGNERLMGDICKLFVRQYW